MKNFDPDRDLVAVVVHGEPTRLVRGRLQALHEMRAWAAQRACTDLDAAADVMRDNADVKNFMEGSNTSCCGHYLFDTIRLDVVKVPS